MTSPHQPAPDGGRSYEEIAALRTVQVPGNIDQGMYDRAENARGSFLGNILSGFGSVGQAIGQALNDLVAAFFGNYTGSNQALLDFQDGQLALNERVDLLTEVSGYCRTYQDRNWSVLPGIHQIPMEKRLGPMKNAHNGDNGIYLDAPGTWRIDAIITARQGGGVIPEAYHSQLYIRVYDENGGLYSEQRVDGTIDSHRQLSVVGFTTVVIEDPGYHVRLYWSHGSIKRSLIGGTSRSLLSVNRWDVDTGDFFRDDDVPDGGELGG